MPLVRILEHSFGLVFVDAPSECEAGPNILPIFEDEAPFHSWLGDGVSYNGAPDHEAMEATIHLLNDLESSYPNIVGILGFSQGAAVGVGMLLRDQRRHMLGLPSVGYRFGVFAGDVRLPVIFEHQYFNSGASTPSNEGNSSQLSLGLTTPTIHATGHLDALAAKGNRLSKSEVGTNAMIFLNYGCHEMPHRAEDVQELARRVEVLYNKF